MKSYSDINNRLGHIYNFPIRIGGFLIAVIGVAILLTRGWGFLVGPILMLAGLYFATALSGISINLKDKAVWQYNSYIGYRTGKWKEYPTYKYICIIKKNIKGQKFKQVPEASIGASYQFEINLVSRSQRGKVLLDILYNREDAEFKAKRYAEEMSISVVEYEPPSRAKTRVSSAKKTKEE